ncbi:hypothetical protein LSH36_147g09041 [Paralvinella palmiformis]|uniref:IGFBP N-terminal domain-containing protein n=1 Tax=Paralvinella palmiformis TaxID=53620 RepID=A0AAD9N7J8_9ANNE|nr:hypothetical protein LSH36_147g09041 [Paralvinella palmiformis]
MSPKLRSFAMDLRMLGTTGYRVVAWAYCLIILDHIFVTSSSTSSVRVGVGAADVKPISQSLELQCPPCNKLHCSPRNVRRLRCKGGITRGVCNCCPVCAKLQGESCGGQWNFLGKCDRGLRCIPDESPRNDITEILTMADRKKTWIPQGKCRRAVVLNLSGYVPLTYQVTLSWRLILRIAFRSEFRQSAGREPAFGIRDPGAVNRCHVGGTGSKDIRLGGRSS